MKTLDNFLNKLVFGIFKNYPYFFLVEHKCILVFVGFKIFVSIEKDGNW